MTVDATTPPEERRGLRNRPLVPITCEEAQCRRLFPSGHGEDVEHYLTMRVQRMSLADPTKVAE